ncbi:MAG: hypothetical protein WD795_04355 [Woeseia sp.]
MNVMRMTVILMAPLLLSACGNSAVCDEPRLYQQSELGERIEAPEGLDPLEPGREMTIPDASPRDPRPEGSPCLEFPPTLRTDGD